MENVLEFKGFQELNHDELMLVDGGNWLSHTWNVVSAVAVGGLGYIAGVGTTVGAMNAVNSAMLGAQKGAMFGPKGIVAGAIVGGLMGGVAAINTFWR